VSRLETLSRGLGLDRSSLIDIASVMYGARPMGLLHLPSSADMQVDRLLDGAGLRLLHRRALRRRMDPCTHDALLEPADAGRSADWTGASHELWSESWFGERDAEDVDIRAMELRTGEMLGYPPCCVRANGRCTTLVGYYRSYLASSQPAMWQVNRLATAISGARLLPDYFPCCLRCESSRAFAQRCSRAGRQALGDDWIDELEADLQAPLTLWNGALVLWRRWRRSSDALELHSAGAVSVPLHRLARLPAGSIPSGEGPMLIPFEHLGSPRRLVLVSADGGTAEVHSRALE
jgi:hypothetical protein